MNTNLLTRAVLGLVAASAVALGSSSARAYSYQSPISDGCHEMLATDAFHVLRAAEPEAAAPMPSSGDDVAVIGDLPFDTEADMRDIGAVTFLIGMRDNDLKGHDGIDTTTLATVHGNPDGQREHCLRRREHDEPDGTAEALADCRDFIEQLVLHAIDQGVDDATLMPSATARTKVTVWLAIAGHAEPMLPIFYIYMGQAIHALQDSFTHMYRSPPDYKQVTVAQNWIDVVDGNYEERRDGPPHMTALDQCRGTDGFREARESVAVEASLQLLDAAINPSVPKADRARHVSAVLDEYLSYKPGCTYDNRWCDAQENQYRDTNACSCHMAGGQGPMTGGAGALVALCALLLRRHRKIAVAAGAVLLCLAPKLALADEVAPQPVDTVRTLQAPSASPWGLSAVAAASVDHGSFAASLGGRYGMNSPWMVGLDAEWNPWVSYETKTAQAGVANFYGTVVRRFRINDSIYLRTTGHLGASVLLFSLYGAPAGSFGPYAGLEILGIELKVSPHTRLIIDPADVSLPIPHITGAPLSYREYRLAIGLEFGG